MELSIVLSAAAVSVVKFELTEALTVGVQTTSFVLDPLSNWLSVWFGAKSKAGSKGFEQFGDKVSHIVTF